MKILFKILYTEFRRLIAHFHFMKAQILWRQKNKHNYTSIGNESFPLDKVSVGNFTYGTLSVFSFSGDSDDKLTIGHCCSIAKDVKFLLGGEHAVNWISTFPLYRILIDPSFAEAKSKGTIIVEDDCWIGTNSLILSGVHLGRGTVVAAGSVVVKSTEPYSIVGGVPATIIRKRFTDSVIQKIGKFDFERITPEFVYKHKDVLYTPIEELTENQLAILLSGEASYLNK